MTVTTERAEECALGLDAIKENAAFIGYQYIADNCAIVLRSLAAERDALSKRLTDAERERNHQHGRADRNARQHAAEQKKREQLQAEIEKLRAALRGVLTYYSAPTPTEAKLKKAVLATPIEQARAALGDKE
jgi:hypothetical protein